MTWQSKNIPKSRLFHLYIKKKLSTGDIGKIFNCDHVTVLNYLKKYNIPRRSRLGTRKPVKIAKKVLFNLYNKQKLTQKQIAQRFGHSRYGIQRWMKIYNIKSRGDSISHTKYLKHNFSDNLMGKAYLIGFRLGDLNVYKIHELIQVRCSTTIYEQVVLIDKLFREYGNVHIWKAKRGTYEIIVLLNKSFDFLLPKNDLIEDWILKNKIYFLSFLAGYADAEGSYYLRTPYYKYAKSGWGVFEIQTYDKVIIQTISRELISMGIQNKFSKSKIKGYKDKRGLRHNKDTWRITIVRKQSLWDFIRLIETYHRHANKLKDLKRVKDNLILRNSLPYCQPIVLNSPFLHREAS